MFGDGGTLPDEEHSVDRPHNEVRARSRKIVNIRSEPQVESSGPEFALARS